MPARRGNLTGLVALIMSMSAVSYSVADDESLKDAKPKAGEAQAAEEKKDSQPGEPSLLDKLSKELFKDVDDKPAKSPAAEKEHKLEQAAKGMRNAGEKLDENLTGKETRQVQEQVIRDLDELIKQLQNPQPPPKGGGGGGGGGGSSTGTTGLAQQLQKLGGGAGRAKQGKGQSGQGATNMSGGQEKKTAEGSEERTDSERKAADDAARKKKLEIDVWGHLPQHLREELMNKYGEKMLPKYQNLVKQFYEALSEQNEATPR